MEAYQMLKKQGIVKTDPTHTDKVSYFYLARCITGVLGEVRRGEKCML